MRSIISGFLRGVIRRRYTFLCYTHSEAPRVERSTLTAVELRSNKLGLTRLVPSPRRRPAVQVRILTHHLVDGVAKYSPRPPAPLPASPGPTVDEDTHKFGFPQTFRD